MAGKVVPPPPEALYHALWVSYRDGLREKRKLMRAHHVGWPLVDQAIERGWPETGFAPLKERVVLWERQAAAAKVTELAVEDRRQAEAKGKREAQTWKQLQPRATLQASDALSALEVLGKKIRAAADAATFVRYRTVLTLVDGKVTKHDQPYVCGVAVAQAARMWASAFNDTGRALGQLIGTPPKVEDGAVPEVSPEEWALIQSGQLPPGWTAETLGRVLLKMQTGAP